MVVIEENFEELFAEQINRKQVNALKVAQKRLNAVEQKRAREKWIDEDKQRNGRRPRQPLTQMAGRDDSYMKKYCRDDLKTNWALQMTLFPAQSLEPWKTPVYGMAKLKRGQLSGSGSVNLKIIKVVFWLDRIIDTGEDPNFMKPERTVELEALKLETATTSALQELKELSAASQALVSK